MREEQGLTLRKAFAQRLAAQLVVPS